MDIKEEVKEPVADYSVLACKGCGLTKKRFRSGIYPNAKDQRWVDELGKQWSGKTCSDCHRENCAKRKRAKTRSKVIASE